MDIECTVRSLIKTYKTNDPFELAGYLNIKAAKKAATEDNPLSIEHIYKEYYNLMYKKALDF